MENRNYEVNRDDVYIGRVAKINGVYREDDGTGLWIKAGELAPMGYPRHRNYRSMLFVPDGNNYANDLLYQSPNYPVLNMTDDDVFTNLKEDTIVIEYYRSLASLLEYLEYDKTLTYEDIIRIKNTIFSGHFAKDNCELFGWHRLSEDKNIYTGGSDGILDSDYFETLDLLGDCDLSTAIRMESKMNAFKPFKEEGPIKKLSII